MYNKFMNKNYLSLLPEFAITISILYVYSHRLLSILQGEVLPTTTGMDALLVELMSVVFTIIVISFGILFFRSHKENIFKLGAQLLGLIGLTGGIILLMIHSGERGFLDPTLLYILVGATILKIVKYIKNKHDHAGAIRSILGYVFIYIGCFIVAMMIDLHILEYHFAITNSTSDPTTYLDQSALRIDTLAALIYYFLIGILGPIITMIRQNKKSSLFPTFFSIFS